MNPWLIYLTLNVIVRLTKKYLMQAILLIRYLSVFLVSNARKKEDDESGAICYI